MISERRDEGGRSRDDGRPESYNCRKAVMQCVRTSSKAISLSCKTISPRRCEGIGCLVRPRDVFHVPREVWADFISFDSTVSAKSTMRPVFCVGEFTEQREMVMKGGVRSKSHCFTFNLLRRSVRTRLRSTRLLEKSCGDARRNCCCA